MIFEKMPSPGLGLYLNGWFLRFDTRSFFVPFSSNERGTDGMKIKSEITFTNEGRIK